MKTCVSLVTAIMLLVAGLVGTAPAEVVGRLTQVEGRVDLLKGGKLPATTVKLEDKVEPGDVLRTKSLSKAQITFIDNTVITISPESRIAIEEYMFDPAKGKRNAVLQLFQGMALAVVSKIFKVEQPDFVLKTHTAIMGVRGTEVGVRLGPNDSTFLNFQGLTRVASIFPEVSGDLFRKAAKVAYSFTKGYVDLGDMQGTTVVRGLPPTVPYTITEEDRKMFMRQLVANVMSRRGGKEAVPTTYQAPGEGAGAGAAETGGVAGAVFPAGIESPGGMNPNAILTAGVYTPPKLVSQSTISPTLNFIFNQAWTGPATLTVVTQPTANFTNTGPGLGTITHIFPNVSPFFPNGFTVSNLFIQATLTSPSTYWLNGWRGIFNSTATGTLSGPANGTLSGVMNMIISIPNDITFRLTGPIIYSNGTLTFNFRFDPQTPTRNIFNFRGGDPRGFVNTGSWTQVRR